MAERRRGVIVHAELSCLTCGYDVGDVEGERGADVGDLVFLPMHQGDRLLVDGKGHFQCPRCGGRVLPHGVSRVHRPIDRATVLEADLTEAIARGYMP
jgi:DNA-directed RNA polymerase subunit RPC12/RpoP